MIETWMQQNAEPAQFILFFGLLALFSLVELLAPRRRHGRNRSKRWAANFTLTLLNLIVMALLPVTFVGAAAWAQDLGLGLLNLMPLPMIALFASTMFLRGFISFITHYLGHHVPWFWRVHRVHHLDPELDVSTTVRFHPLEFAINLAIGVPLVVGLGLTPWVLLAYEVLDAGVVLFSHANVRLPGPIDRLLRYLIVTPDLHRVHHSRWQPETNSNFGAVFPIWDILFGTFRTSTRQPHESMELGLEGVPEERTTALRWLLTSPFQPSDNKTSSTLSRPTVSTL